uniref:BRCT domain-containing protein n=1 Tax=Sphenodon punctatus TaxID=8508 RepID=A0A8D0GX57_SPHPU
MTVAIFANCVFFLKVNSLAIREKNRLKACIKENGGIISFMLKPECTHVIVDNVDVLSSSHLKVILKYQLPLVNADFIWRSVEERRLLQVDEYKSNESLEGTTNQEPSIYGVENSPFSEDYRKKEDQGTEKNDDSDDLEPVEDQPMEISPSTDEPDKE